MFLNQFLYRRAIVLLDFVVICIHFPTNILTGNYFQHFCYFYFVIDSINALTVNFEKHRKEKHTVWAPSGKLARIHSITTLQGSTLNRP